jgi:hypothetical protein
MSELPIVNLKLNRGKSLDKFAALCETVKEKSKKDMLTNVDKKELLSCFESVKEAHDSLLAKMDNIESATEFIPQMEDAAQMKDDILKSFPSENDCKNDFEDACIAYEEWLQLEEIERQQLELNLRKKRVQLKAKLDQAKLKVKESQPLIRDDEEKYKLPTPNYIIIDKSTPDSLSECESEVSALVKQLNNVSFQMSLPKPLKTFSNNGTNIVSDEKDLRDAMDLWNSEFIKSAMTQRHMEWEFNPPHASHMGSVWERVIRSVKVMRSITKEGSFKNESLLTFMCLVENILNDRPLTNMSNDIEDPSVLTPNTLLLLKGNSCLRNGLFNEDDNHPQGWWRYVNYLADIFWKRWQKKYLPLLQTHSNLKIGDLVLKVNDTKPQPKLAHGDYHHC